MNMKVECVFPKVPMSSPYPIENRGSGSTGQLLGEWPGCPVGGQEGPLATKWLPSQPAVCGGNCSFSNSLLEARPGDTGGCGSFNTSIGGYSLGTALGKEERDGGGGEHAWGRRWGVRVVPRGWERDNRPCCHPFRSPTLLSKCPPPARSVPALFHPGWARHGLEGCVWPHLT